MPPSTRNRLFAGLLALGSILGAPGAYAAAPTTAVPTSPQPGTARPPAADQEPNGPRSPAGRKPAPAAFTTEKGVHIADVDLGDVDLGPKGSPYRAPVRGRLVLPATAGKPAPLVVVSHLRSPNCADGTFAYPCPRGEERRLDRGMSYLAEHLAAKGYAVVVPDVGPLFIPDSVKKPYDQVGGWTTVVDTFLAKVRAEVAGDGKTFGIPLKNRIDTATAALIAHSRSGNLAGEVAAAWTARPTRISSILGYGPSYGTPGSDGAFTPMVPPNVPYLAVLGDKDRDVRNQPTDWLTEHLRTGRTAPAAVGVVRGYGHNYVNRALSAAKDDDRTACEPGKCPDAAAHESLLTDVSTRWLASVRGTPDPQIPLAVTGPLGDRLGSVPVRWLAVSNHAKRQIGYDAGQAGTVLTGPTGPLTPCTMYHPQQPDKPGDSCADPAKGVLELLGRITPVELGKGRGADIRTSVPAATHIALALTPYGSRADGRKHTALSVTVHTADGRRATIPVPAQDPVLRDTAGEDGNGSYALGTVRVTLPPEVAGRTVERVELRGDEHGGRIAVRQVDIIAK